MNDTTLKIRLAELIRDVNKHPHKAELIKLMTEQMADDDEYLLM